MHIGKADDVHWPILASQEFIMPSKSSAIPYNGPIMFDRFFR